MRYAAALALWILAAFACERAKAISTWEDVLRDLPIIVRPPSSVPPNNARFRSIESPFAPPAAGINEIDSGPDADARASGVHFRALPFVVAISETQNLARDFICTGVVIHRAWVLTAAHCTYNLARRWPVDAEPHVFSETLSLANPGPRFAVEEIIEHPHYDARTLQHDVALIRIAAESEKESVPIRLEGPPIAEQVGEITTVIGWGVTRRLTRFTHREQLELVQFVIENAGGCFSYARTAPSSRAGLFCARSLLLHHDVCFRFGGSPLLSYDRSGRLYVAGLVSWPAECPAEYAKPNTFLDVQHYVPWIKSVIGATRVGG
jgi:secreted trypsin-like serine protease